MIATCNSSNQKESQPGMTETLLWSLSQLKVIDEFQCSWNPVGGARLPSISKKDSHVFADIPNADLSFTAKPAENEPRLWEKSRGQVQQGLRRLKVCLSARGDR
jgi:hypothetical protein